MFNRLAGNQRVKDLLERMLESDRVPGALLFAGTEGVGKKLFAIEVAKALNCRSPRGVEACDECSACARIAKFNFPQSDKSEDWEQLIRTDDADKLNDSSANALLKILEEPPRTSYIILITSRPAMLLPTIRSRCQAIRFSPLTVDEIEQYLSRDKNAKAEEILLRARLAGGSISRALAGDLESYASRRADMLRVLEALAISGDRYQLLSLSEELNSARYKDIYESMLDILEGLIRDAWMLSLGR